MKRISAGSYAGHSKPLGRTFTLHLDTDLGLWRLTLEGYSTVLEAKHKKSLLSQLQYMEQQQQSGTLI